MIKRVEFLTGHSSDSMMPNRVISYYLFGIILIYRSIKIITKSSALTHDRKNIVVNKELGLYLDAELVNFLCSASDRLKAHQD